MKDCPEDCRDICCSHVPRIRSACHFPLTNKFRHVVQIFVLRIWARKRFFVLAAPIQLWISDMKNGLACLMPWYLLRRALSSPCPSIPYRFCCIFLPSWNFLKTLRSKKKVLLMNSIPTKHLWNFRALKSADRQILNYTKFNNRRIESCEMFGRDVCIWLFVLVRSPSCCTYITKVIYGDVYT